MLKHYLLSTLRHLCKRRLYSFISLLSLTVGLSVFCLISLHVRHELSYNKNWQDAGLIHRMTHKQGGGLAQQPPTTAFSAEFILNLYDYLEEFVSGYSEVSTIHTPIEDDQSNRGLTVLIADAGFGDVFEMNVVAGSMTRVMEGSGFIALERSQAELHFGEHETAIGRNIKLSGPNYISSNPDFVPAQPTEFEVAAVYELPDPVSTSTRFQAIAPDNVHTQGVLPTVHGEPVSSINIWMKLKENVDPEQINTRLDSYLDDYLLYTRDDVDLQGKSYSELFDFHLQALTDIYLSREITETPGGDSVRLLTFSVVALLVLMAGSSNVISLGLAAVMERRREVGIRKSVGAEQRDIILQYMGEPILLALIALVPTVALVKAIHPAFANLLSITRMPAIGLPEIWLMSGIALFVGLVNGIYPALVLARVKPVAILKTQGVHPRGQSLNLRSLLVGLQFCFSLVLLIVTTGLYMQLNITRHQPLGLSVENVGSADINFQLLQTRSEIASVFANELSRLPDIEAVAPVLNTPLQSPGTQIEYQLVDNQQEMQGVTVIRTPAKIGLFDLLEIPLLAGRHFDQSRDSNQNVQDSATPPVQNIIINRVALNALQYGSTNQVLGNRYFLLFDNGARRNYTPVEVIGVVEDSMLSSLKTRPSAEVFYLESFTGPSVLFRYDNTAGADIQQRVNDVALAVTDYPASVTFLEDQLNRAFEQEQRESRLLLMCAGLALFLSCIGLYGLVSVALRTQVKEVGVRKVLGASTAGVVLLFLKRFSLPVLLANLIAWPVAAYFVLQWIERFPYQLEKAWLLPICLGNSALVLVIAWLTVSGLTWQAASTRPVKSLRYE